MNITPSAATLGVSIFGAGELKDIVVSYTSPFFCTCIEGGSCMSIEVESSQIFSLFTLQKY